MKKKFKELEVVKLKYGIPAGNLKKGEIGTIVHVYQSSNAYEVEFVSPLKHFPYSKTKAVVTLMPEDLEKYEKEK